MYVCRCTVYVCWDVVFILLTSIFGFHASLYVYVIFRTSKYIAGVSFINLSFILTFLEEEEEVADARVSVLLVVCLTVCNWITAILPGVFKYKEYLTAQYSSGVVAWHVFCIIFGILTMSLMALPTVQTVQCCVVSFDNMKGFTKTIEFNCSSYSCDYMNMFIIIPFLSIVWSTLSVHYQIHNIFRYLHERQQEEGSYDRLIQRLTAVHREGGHRGSTGPGERGGNLEMNIDLEGIILASEMHL